MAVRQGGALHRKPPKVPTAPAAADAEAARADGEDDAAHRTRAPTGIQIYKSTQVAKVRFPCQSVPAHMVT